VYGAIQQGGQAFMGKQQMQMVFMEYQLQQVLVSEHQHKVIMAYSLNQQVASPEDFRMMTRLLIQ